MVDPQRPSLSDWRYLPILAVVFLVALRLCIGWQFLYEGLWKINTLDTATPWTSEGFLKNAEGPLRNFFREKMAEDPNDFRWLDQEWVENRWDRWADGFIAHYGLDEDQQRRLHAMLEGETDFRAILKEMPEGVEIPESLRETVSFDPKLQRLIVAGTAHLTPSERDQLLKLVEIPEEPNDENRAQWEMAQAYHKAVEEVFTRSSRLSFKERLQVSLGPSDPNRTRMVFSNFKGTLGHEAPESIDDYYRELIASYEANRKRAKSTGLDFQQGHLDHEWRALQQLRTELSGPIKALDRQLKTDAKKLLNKEQLELGPLPEQWTRQRLIDFATIVALTGLGLLLICGLATRPAAVMGAGMLMSFYLVWPPLPGVIDPPGSTEHALFINKNFIEAVALLAIASLPTGQWFGLDRWIWLGWNRLRSGGKSRPLAPESTTPRKPAEPAQVAARS